MQKLEESASWFSNVSDTTASEVEPVKDEEAPPRQITASQRLKLAEALSESATWLGYDVSDSEDEDASEEVAPDTKNAGEQGPEVFRAWEKQGMARSHSC